MRLAIALATALVSCAVLPAQVNKCNLTGIVRDSTAAAVPSVTIKLTNTATGAARVEATDESGFYRFTLVDRGVYRLEAERSGFKRFQQDGVELVTGETTTIDIALSVGEVAESVTVTGEAAALRTETGSLGTTVNTQVLNELPLIGRNPYVFLTLSPGIQYTGDPGALNPWDVAGPSAFAAAGSEARSEFLLDGIPNMGISNVSLSPSPDAVQEMRVQTNGYDAEFGHAGAAFVNVSTRSGTNQYHGTAYWYLRNDNLNATNFFTNRIGSRKNEFKQNTYGASFGGPFRIPKIYNGIDKTHYFFNFEGTQIRGASFARAIVPTERERAGDFSQSLDRSGRPFNIFDPATTRQEGTAFVRSPFPGNQVPLGRFDPVSVNALKYYPLPNRTPAGGSLQNFENPQIGGRKWASLASRVDHQINANHSLFFRYGWNHRTDPSSAFYGESCCRPAGNPTDGQDEFERGNIGAGGSYTWIMSSRMVFDARVGFTRYFDANKMYGEGFDVRTLGFPDVFAQSLAFATFPRFAMADADVENLGAGRVTSRTFINVYNPQVNLHYTLSRHALKAGYRYMVNQQNAFAPNRSGGIFTFGRAFTQGPNATQVSANTGHDFAAFLLGTPNSGSADVNAAPALQNTYHAVYFHDDWKASSRLTLNLGLRLEHENGTTDRFNRGNAGLDLAVASPLEAQAKANYARNPIPELATLNVKGGLRFLAVENTPREHLSMSAAVWAPRIGYAYRLTNRIVSRGGYGLFYVPNNISNYRLDGFSLATQMVASLDNNLTPFNTLRNPFPSGLSRPPGSAGGLLTGTGQSITAGVAGNANFLPEFRHGLNQQFSQGFQVVLPGDFSIQASYVGSLNQRLTITRNVNQYPDQFLALGTRLNARVPNPFLGVVTDPTSALSQSTITVQQLLRPYPHYTGITRSSLPLGRSWYHSFQFEASKRMAMGLYFGVAFTQSKLMEATSYLNPNNAGPEKVISDSDRAQRLVIHGLYELPFGPGRNFITSTNPIVRRLVSSWQVNWVATFQTGAPLAFASAERPRTSSNNLYEVDNYFDTTQFAPQQPFTLRAFSSRTSDLRAPGINKWDITVQKTVLVREGMNFKVQAEFYNAFNRAHLGTPNTTPTSASFGRITGTFLGPREIQLSGRFTF
ncbi:MAG TPA: carboxypeptidase-like regulatory domain-containing protein [Bryobacteraceae bacterium]|nr:carboxypeptidase-like regulatory domain-containing protein [Bryobacteraceae bacterium]